MKNNRVKKLMTSAVILLAGLAFAMSSYAQENNTQEKVRLMMAAVQAKDSGDLYKAKENLESLLEIVPSDKSIQSLLASVNDSITLQESRIIAEKKAATAVAQAKISDRKTAPEAPTYYPMQVSEPTYDVTKEEIAAATVMAEATLAEATLAEVNEETLLNKALLRQQKTVMAVYDLIDEFDDLIRAGKIDEAAKRLDEAKYKLGIIGSDSADTKAARGALNEALAYLAKLRTERALTEGKFPEAKAYAQEYSTVAEKAADGDALLSKVEDYNDDPRRHNLESVSPDYVIRQKEIASLMKKGKIQYLYGDYDGARRTFRDIETVDNENMQAKTYLSLIAERMSMVGQKTQETTRKQMIAEVDNMWQLPQIYQGNMVSENSNAVVSPIVEKLDKIIIDEVNFENAPLSRIIYTLSELSVDFDKSTEGSPGVNIVFMGEGEGAPITLNVRKASLGRLLSLATQKAKYSYEIQDDMILVVEGDPNASVLDLDTEEIPINTSALNSRILNIKTDTASSDSSSPWDSSSSSSSSSSGGSEEVSQEDKDKRLKQFFENRGVSFAKGAVVSCTEDAVTITNTPKNIEKVRNILLRYNEVEQVEIEAKFMEVNQGSLDMLAFNYSMAKDNKVLFQTNNRLLSATLAQTNAGETDTTIVSPIYEYDTATGTYVVTSYDEQPYPQNIPSLPSSINLASTALDTVSTVLGVINGYTAEIVVNALSQEQGTDLLTAPKLTVMSGESANIRVAQVMYYPTEFSDVQSDVGSSSGTGYTSSAGVTITPGTPSNFAEALIGVEMDISPLVEQDKSITIKLNPQVREFEGFMEYGGMAIAISSGTTVTVPSGFIQPVFAIRSIDTRVCVFDGATIVLGGLVREEVKTVNDGVPFLKDIPLLGTLFRSKGEARQKKNLLIFVTANRITPGGSLRNSLFSGVSSSSVYQNPMVRSPGGAITRVKEIEEVSED